MKHLLPLTIFSLCAAVLTLHASPAHAIFVGKIRVDIQDGKNFEEFFVLNRSDRKKLLTFEWNDYYVDQDGKFVTLEEGQTYPGYRPASNLIRHSPRRVVLDPGESQRIRMYAKRSADMAPGEYHSHFTILAEPVREDENLETAEGTIRGKVSINAGVSLPVFLRHGPTTVNTSIEEAYIYTKDGLDHLYMRVSNDSTRSTYAQITYNCTLPTGEVIQQEGQNMRTYTEVKQITWDEPVSKNVNVRQCVNLSITLNDPDDFEYSKTPMDTAAVEIR